MKRGRKEGKLQLNNSHYKAIIALASGEEKESVADRIGVTIRTIDRWLQREDFQELYHQACREAYRNGLATLCEGSADAALKLRGIINDPDVPSAVKVRAINVLFTHAATIEESSNELVHAVKILLRNKCIPTPVFNNLRSRIDNLQDEIKSSFNLEDNSRGESELIKLIQGAVLGGDVSGSSDDES